MFRIAFKTELNVGLHYLLTDNPFEDMAFLEDNGATIVEVL